MGWWNPVANLREYIFSNPPGATFFLCVLTLAITFLSLSSYSRTHTLPNPDTAKDWNQLLFALAQLKLCESVNMSSSQSMSVPPSTLTELDEAASAGPNSTESPPVTSWHLRVPLVVSASSAGDSPGDISLHTTLKASQLHLGECPVSKKRFQSIQVEVSDAAPAASQQCYSLHSKEDPTLTVMLTKEERGLAVHHLLEFSVCLFVFCFLFCFAASLSHTMKRHHPSIGLDRQNEPLIHQN